MSSYKDTLQRGDKIGCYQIEEVLGRGGFAVTYLATDVNLDVQVAVKEYLPREITQRDSNLQVSARKQEFAEDYDVGLQSFAREAKTLARFKHPNIVRVHQVLHDNNTAYMVMDYEQGQELGEILERQETLKEEELRAVLLPVLDGVEEIHRHGFVHRDIKPSNIYVRHNGTPVLIDFGAARYTLSETTQQLTAVVTVGYTPIEQYNVSDDAQGPWSDIYALAAVCYEAVTGDMPTDSVTRASASVTRGDDPLPAVRSAAKHTYSDDCLDAIDWGLRMAAEDRPQVIAQWRDSFDGIFNPASAYKEQTDVSIYSPHRVDQPLRQDASSGHQNARPADNRHHAQEHFESVPLNDQPGIPANTGVVAIKPDTVRMPSERSKENHGDQNHSVQSRNTEDQAGQTYVGQNKAPDSQSAQAYSENPNSGMPPVPQRTDTPAINTGNVANDSAIEAEQRNVLRRTPYDQGLENESQTQTISEQNDNTEQPRKRSKLERPSHLVKEPPIDKRILRDEIEFDDSDWDYEPPTRNSPFRFLLPALGLGAVVVGSVLFVNDPEKITSLPAAISNLGNRGPNLTTAEALNLAQQKMNESEYLFPEDKSALDYFQLVLASDPSNTTAQAGVESVESAVKAQIAAHVQDENLSAANRLLDRANKKGLRLDELPQTSANFTGGSGSSTPSTSVIVDQTASVQPIENDPVLRSNDQNADKNAELDSQNTSSQGVTDVSSRTEEDSSLTPFIREKIVQIESLVKQERFSEALELYNDTDKYLPDQTVSRQLLATIEAGQSTDQSSTGQTTTVETTTVSSQDASAEVDDTAQSTQDVLTATDASDFDATSDQNTLALVTRNDSSTDTPPAQQPIQQPQVQTSRARTSFIAATGSTADHLNKLRTALESKDMDSVISISDTLSPGRIQFLSRMFQRYDRLDVVIDDVDSSGSSASAKLNVSMFNRSDDGSFYSAGKWSGVTLNVNQDQGIWQKIDW